MLVNKCYFPFMQQLFQHSTFKVLMKIAKFYYCIYQEHNPYIYKTLFSPHTLATHAQYSPKYSIIEQ